MKTEVSNETYAKIKDQIEADKKKEKPEFELINICCLRISVDFSKSAPIIICSDYNQKGQIHCGNIGNFVTSDCISVREAKGLIKALQSAIDHVEANK